MDSPKSPACVFLVWVPLKQTLRHSLGQIVYLSVVFRKHNDGVGKSKKTGRKIKDVFINWLLL